MAEIQCSMPVSLPKRPKIHFKVAQQGKQQALRDYCSKIYIEINPYLLEIGKIFKDRNL